MTGEPLRRELVPIGVDLFARRWTKFRRWTGGVIVSADAAIVDGQYELLNVKLAAVKEGPTINADILRRVSLADLLDPGDQLFNDLYQPRGGVVAKATPPDPLITKDGRYGPTEDRLMAVARFHTAAHLYGLNATKMTAAYFGLAQSTCDRWLRKARDNGLLRNLPPTS